MPDRHQPLLTREETTIYGLIASRPKEEVRILNREVVTAIRDMSRQTALILIALVLSVTFLIALFLVEPNGYSGSGTGGETTEPLKTPGED